MPLSLTNAAQAWNAEEFLFWDPTTDTFGPGVAGRMKRIDPFVSLWTKASRRHNIFFNPGTDVSNVAVIKHNLSGLILLLSPTFEQDAWQGGPAYTEMRRAHKVTPPSGGKGMYRPIVISGSGDDLGPVSLGPPVTVYLDVERSGSGEPNETVNVVQEEVYVYCSANISPNPGDFLTLNADTYRVDEWFHDIGFLAGKAVLADPAYVTVTFLLPGGAIFDPATGTLTNSAAAERQVSVQIDSSEVVGRPSEQDLDEKRTLYIFTHHIGFDPEPGQQVEISGRVYRVTRADNNVERKQWKVEVRP